MKDTNLFYLMHLLKALAAVLFVSISSLSAQNLNLTKNTTLDFGLGGGGSVSGINFTADISGTTKIPQSYEWSINGGSSFTTPSTSNTYSPIFTSDGSYAITYKVTFTDGTKMQSSVKLPFKIYTNVKLVPSLENDVLKVCQGSIVKLTAKLFNVNTNTEITDISLPDNNYQWKTIGSNVPSIPVATIKEPDANFSNVVSGNTEIGVNYNYASYSGIFIATSSNLKISISDKLIINSISINNLCDPSNIKFDVATTGGFANEKENLTWSFGDNQTAENTYVHSYASSGKYTVTLKLNSVSAACQAEYNSTFQIGSPTISINKNDASTEICSNQNTSFSATQTPFSVPIQWYLDDEIINGATANTLNYKFLEAGTHTLKVKTSDGCPSSSTPYKVTINSTPVPKYTYNIEGQCNTVDFSNGTMPNSDFNYTWSYKNASNTIILNEENKASFSYSFPEAGTYNVVLTASNKNASSCAASTSKNIKVNGANIKIISEIGNTTCTTFPISLDLSTTNIADGMIPQYYLVDWGDGSDISEQIPYEAGKAVTTPKHIYATAKDDPYQIVVHLISTGGGCETTENTFPITVSEACPVGESYGFKRIKDCDNKLQLSIEETTKKISKIVYLGESQNFDFLKKTATDVANLFTYTFTESGVKYVQVTYSDGPSVKFQVNMIDEHPLISGNQNYASNLCKGNNLTLNVDVDATNISSFIWSVDEETQRNGNGVTVKNTSFTRKYPSSGNDYNVKYTLIDNNGCEVPSGNFIVSPKAPIVDFSLLESSNATIHPKTENSDAYYSTCSAILNAKINGSSASTNLQWNWTLDGKVLEDKTANPTFTIENNSGSIQTHNLTLIAISDNGSGCTSTPVSKIIARLSRPIASFTIADNNTSRCGDQNQQRLVYSFANTSQSSNNASYEWNWGDGTTESNNSKNITHRYNLEAGSYSHSYNPILTLTDENNCKDIFPKTGSVDATDSKNIVRLSRPKALFSLEDISENTKCIPKKIQLTNQSENATEYKWDYGDNGSATAFGSFQETSTYTYFDLDPSKPNQPTLRTISLTAKDADGCTMVYSSPEPIALNGISATLKKSSTGIFCENDKPNIEYEVSYIPSQPLNEFQIQWNFGDNSDNYSSENINTYLHEYSKSGLYNPIAVISGNINGATCTATANLENGESLIIYDNPTLSELNNSPKVCDGSSFNVSINTNENILTAPDGNPYTYKYAWDPADNITEMVSNGIISYTITPSQNESYTLDAFNGFCHLQNKISSTYISNPDILFGKNIHICGPKGGQTTFDITLENADEILNWAVGDDESKMDWIEEIDKNKTYKLTIPDGYTQYETPFSFTIKNSQANCPEVTKIDKFYVTKDIEIKNVHLLLNGTNYINYTSAITAGQKVEIVPTITQNNDKSILIYSWTPANLLTNPNTLTPSFISDKSQTFQLKIQNDQDCERTLDVPIIVTDLPDVKKYQQNIANAFSPNGDGKNDYFFISGFGIKKINHLAIYNRNGQKVFESSNTLPNDQLKGWNGRFANGKDAPVANYVYIAQIETNLGQKLDLKGSIILIR